MKTFKVNDRTRITVGKTVLLKLRSGRSIKVYRKDDCPLRYKFELISRTGETIYRTSSPHSNINEIIPLFDADYPQYGCELEPLTHVRYNEQTQEYEYKEFNFNKL